MPDRKILFETGTISNVDADARVTDQDVIDAMYAVEEGREKRMKEESKKQSIATEREKYFAQYYVCPYCDAEIDKINDKATLIAHHSTCPRRVQYQRKIDWERESEIDGLQKMRYILHRILQADADVERLEKKMQDPTISEREKKYLIAQEIDDAKAIKRRELVEKDKLLNHENEITRKAAQKVYDDYLKLSSDYERRKKHHVY